MKVRLRLRKGKILRGAIEEDHRRRNAKQVKGRIKGSEVS
jgi:hypothetical protein